MTTEEELLSQRSSGFDTWLSDLWTSTEERWHGTLSEDYIKWLKELFKTKEANYRKDGLEEEAMKELLEYRITRSEALLEKGWPEERIKEDLDMRVARETGLPRELFYYDEESKALFNKALIEGSEELHNLRVMVVGQAAVGKTTLTRRLLGMEVQIEQYDSTNGIEVHIHPCEVDINTGEWEISKEFVKQDVHSRRAAKILRHYKRKPKKEEAKENSDPTGGEPKEDNREKESDPSDSSGVTPNTPQTAKREIDEMEIENLVKRLREEAMHLKSMEEKGRSEVASVSFYDFAGQFIFYSSHPTFMSARAVYLLVLDLTMFIDDTVEEDDWYGDISGVRKLTVREYFENWLRTIYLYAVERGEPMPQVILVGTHLDKLPVDGREEQIESFFDGMRLLLADTPLIELLADVEFAVDNTREDGDHYMPIKDTILQIAKSQPTWREKFPSRWLPFEQELARLKKRGEKVILLTDVEKLNKELDVQIRDNELQLVLRFLHDTGEILFYDDGTSLREKIILDPVFLIDALKCIVTSRKFAVRDRSITRDWMEFEKTAVICKSTIEQIWSRPAHRKFFEHREHLLGLMERLHFLAVPVLEEGESERPKADVRYIVPCKLKDTPEKSLSVPQLSEVFKTSTFCMVSKEKFLPVAAFHKLMAACVEKWPLVEQAGKKQIFCGLFRFNLDQSKQHKLTVLLIDFAIHAFVTCFGTSEKLNPNVCIDARTFLTESLSRILQGMDLPPLVEECIQCPDLHADRAKGYFPVSLLEEYPEVVCDEHEESHKINSGDLMRHWWKKGGRAGDSNPGATASYHMTQEHVNFARLCNALLTICSDCLRDVLLKYCPSQHANIYAAIRSKKKKLLGTKYQKGLLNADQQVKVFPDPKFRYCGASDQFDLSLLYILIRNISTVQKPCTDWGEEPMEKPRDATVGANVERIRRIRNDVLAHSKDGKMSEDNFNAFWSQIKECLSDIEAYIGRKGYGEAMEMLRKSDIDETTAGRLCHDIQGIKVAQETVSSQVESLTSKIRQLEQKIEALGSQSAVSEDEDGESSNEGSGEAAALPLFKGLKRKEYHDENAELEPKLPKK